MWLAGPGPGSTVLRKEAEAGGFSLGFPWSPSPSGGCQSLIGLCAVSAMCSSAQWEASLSEWWVWGEVPTLRPSPVPRVGRCSMGQTLLG